MDPTNVIWQVHASVAGRIRYHVPALRERPALAAKLEQMLRDTRGVQAARSNPRTATLLICFDATQAKDAWKLALAELLHVPVRALDQTPPTRPESALERRAVETAERVYAKLATLPANARGAWQHAIDGLVPQRETNGHARARSQSPAANGGDEQAPRWHTLKLDDIFSRIDARAEGLASNQASQRLERDGKNEIEAAKQRTALQIALEQFASTPVAMLGASALLSAVTGSFLDSVAILSVVGVNAAIGFAMERGAERTISALAQPLDQTASVLRDGRPHEITMAEVVVGDTLVLQSGVLIAADARVLEAHRLMIDESSLTGESEPAEKTTDPIDEPDTPLGSRTNMLFRGTLVAAGSGKAIVVATGPRTELGHIHRLAGGVEQRRTPMQEQLDRLGQQLAIGAGAACLGVIGVGLLRGQPPVSLLRTAVSLGVAAVPEGLPTVAMATLARGVSHMRAERVLVRKLAAVETLGATQVVCVDKTGTLTRNRMTVVALQAGLRSYQLQDGKLAGENAGADSNMPPEIEALLRIGVINSEVTVEEKSGALELEGSSTERALVQLGLDFALDVDALRESHPVRSTKQRAEDRPYVAALHDADGGGQLLTVKGSPSQVLALCRHVLQGGQTRELSDDDRRAIERENERMAAQPLRVLGCAQLDRSVDLDEIPTELVWLGLVGMEDPPRKGVAEVLSAFREAGVRAIMMTGDQGSTAEGVARQVGLGSNDHVEVVDAMELESAEPDQIRQLVARADVFARVSPAHKVHLVRALQDAGFITAMTGDGVNDSPALKAADIGVAMGASGANAAREVADLVLEDDELSQLVTAMREGRTIYGDIRKAVRFILATNSSEILFTFACVASGLGEPLTPMQLLWINIMTDIFPELALAVQPAESDVLSRPPRDPKRPMFTQQDLAWTGLEGAAIAAGALAVHLSGQGRGLGFTTLVFAQLLHALSARSEERGLFGSEPIPSNRWLAGTLAGSAAVQLAVTTVPPLRTLFGLTPLRLGDWARVASGALGPFLFNEALKLKRRASDL